MRKFNLIWIMAFLLFVPMAFAGIAERITYIERDTYVQSNSATINFGSEVDMIVRCYDTVDTQRGFMYLNSSNLTIKNLDQYSFTSAELYQYTEYNWWYGAVPIYIYNATDIGYNHSNITYNTWTSQVDTTGSVYKSAEGYVNNVLGWNATDLTSWVNTFGGWTGILYFRTQTLGCGSSIGARYSSSRNLTQAPYFKLTYEYGFDVNALDNYTKYGYNLTDISNFTVTMTNGTDTLINTSNGTTINMGDLVGLWNITISHNEYNEVTYLNHNVSGDLTAYMTQTHEHTNYLECQSCVVQSAQSNGDDGSQDSAVYFQYMADNPKVWHTYSAGNNRALFILDTRGNNTETVNLSSINTAYFVAYQHSYGATSSSGQRYFTVGEDCSTTQNGMPFNYNFTPFVSGGWGSAFPSCSYTIDDYSGWNDAETWQTMTFPSSTGVPRLMWGYLKFQKESDNNEDSNFRGAISQQPTNPAYISIRDWSSNFTIAVVDSVTGDPITTTDITINISNGAWSREDTLSGTNTIVYPFDEGIYDIDITVEGVTETLSDYDLSTDPNYIEQTFTFYFNMSNCSTSETNIALNFTIVDEENESLIITDVTTDFDLVTDFYTTTFDFDLTGQNNYTFCLDPEDIDVTLNGFINYQPEDTSEYPFARQYWFTDATIRGDTTSDITLYVLNGGVSDTVSFTVTHDGLGLSEGKVWVQRYISGNYILVNMVDITAGSGQTDLRTVDTFYKFLVYDSDNVLLGTFGPMTISTSVSLNTFTSQSFDTSWYNYLQLRDYQYTFSYSNITEIADLTYSHSSGLSTEDCLRVVYSEFLNDEQVCYTCSSSASATLQCLITDTDATYTLQYVTYLNGTWFVRAAEQLSLKETLADKIGNDGLFFAFLLIGILAFVGLFNPAAAIWFSLGGLIFVTLLGLINLSITALVGLLFVGGLIAVKLRT